MDDYAEELRCVGCGTKDSVKVCRVCGERYCSDCWSDRDLHECDAQRHLHKNGLPIVPVNDEDELVQYLFKKNHSFSILGH